MADSIHERIEQERKVALPEAQLVRDFRNYARGKQKNTLNNYQRKVLRGVLGHVFCDNVCRKILQETRNRLKFNRYDIEESEQTTKDTLVTYLRDLVVKNKMAEFAGKVHWAALRDGNTAVGLLWNGERVVMVRERWWNSKFGFFLAYDDNDEPTYAVREWRNGKNIYRTIWEPALIRRFKKNGNGWQLRTDLNEGEKNTIFWTRDGKEKGEPIGIPFVHFANHLVPNDGTGDDGSDEPDNHYGISELDGGMLGLNDEINDVHRDITAAARYAGFPMGSATGVTVGKDSQGEEELPKYTPEPGSFFTDQNEKARFSMLQPGSLEELERTLNIKLSTVARQSGVPLHIITGNWPSGEALLRAEQPFVDKIEQIANSFGPAWSSVAHKSTILSNVFGTGTLNEESLIKSYFEPASKRDPLTQAIVVERLAPYLSVTECLRTLGKSPKEIENILDEMEAEIKRGIRKSFETGPSQAIVPRSEGNSNQAGNITGGGTTA